MDNFRGRVKYFGAVPGRSLTAAELKEMIRGSMAGVGVLWHRQMRPKHFTAAGASEYGYSPRKGESGNPSPRGYWASYTGRKQRLKHHRRPLVWSGELETLTEQRRIDTGGTRAKSWVKVVLPAARKANWKHPASSINMREELTRVSDPETDVMVKAHSQSMTERIRTFGKALNKEI